MPAQQQPDILAKPLSLDIRKSRRCLEQRLASLMLSGTERPSIAQLDCGTGLKKRECVKKWCTRFVSTLAIV